MKQTADRSEAADDVDLEVLAGSMRRAYHLALGLRLEDEPADDEAACWASCARKIHALVGGDDDEAIRVSDLAAMMYHCHAGASAPGFDQLPKRSRLGWTAVARHGANVALMDSTDLGRLADHEGFWPRWLAEQLAAA